MSTITSDEALFNECVKIASRVGSLKSIVQNDMEITSEEIIHWEKLVKQNIVDLWDWHKRVKKHIEK